MWTMVCPTDTIGEIRQRRKLAPKPSIPSSYVQENGQYIARKTDPHGKSTTQRDPWVADAIYKGTHEDKRNA